MNLRLDWCDHKAAKYACEKWHYSKTIPKGAGNYIGVWEEGEFIGAIIFGFSISPSVGMTYGLTQFEISELRRVALKSHKAPVSKLISIAIRFFRKHNPGVKMLVSYADTLQNHHGGIYQAGNWVYVGGSAAMRQFKIGGKWRNDTHAYNEKKHLSTDSRTVPSKHKYLYPLTDEMRTRIAPLRKPYPKRASVVQSAERPANQPGAGGSIPTLTHPSDLVLDTGGAAT